MPNPWFRMYSEFANDPKVQMMPEAMQRRLIMLFCERCSEETFHETERSFHWRISDEELAKTKALFLQKGFIDEGWNLLNWNSRQFLSDSSTDRVRRHRQAKKQDETLHLAPETKGNATVTAPDTEADTETEELNTPPTAHEASPKLVELSRSVGDSLESLATPFDADPMETIPSDAPPMQCAALVLERADILAAPHLVRKLGDAIKLLGKVERLGIPDATRLMLQRVKAAQAAGESKWTFWLDDDGWKGNKPQAAEEQRRAQAKVGYVEPPEIDLIAQIVDKTYAKWGDPDPRESVEKALADGVFRDTSVTPDQVLNLLTEWREFRHRQRVKGR